VFTANAGIVYRDLFVPARFRFGVRQKESPSFENWARNAGLTIVALPSEMRFEGAGDALFCGDSLFAGYRFRSDVKSHQWIGERLGVPVLPLELVDPRFYHLDTCFCPIAADLAVYYPGAFDEYGRSVLQDQILRLIEVSPDEAVSFSCNAVVVGQTVILNRGASKLAATLEQYGYAVRPLDFSEFIKSGGSAKCLTLRIDGEEAASWKHAD
jgi:N-dimethylarginine dimethylaminohydrolase